MFRVAVFFAVVAVAFCGAYNKVDTKAYTAPASKDYNSYQAGSNYNGNKGVSNYNGYQAGSNSYNSYDQGYNPCGYGDNGKRLAIRDFCAGYFECKNGEARYYDCDEYEGFDIYQKKCVPDKSCTTVCPKGTGPSYNSIYQYYLGEELLNCPYGTYFDARICTCDHIPGYEYQNSGNQYNGKQYDNNGKQYDSYGKQYDNNGKQYDSYGKQYDSYGKQYDNNDKQYDSYGKQYPAGSYSTYNNAQSNGNYASQYQAPKSADSYAKKSYAKTY